MKLFQKSKEIRGYFGQFGAIEFVQFHQSQQYGFVQFKLEESAVAVLSQASHCVSNHVLTVKAAYDYYQPAFRSGNLMLPPQQNTLLHILVALNDDCLREVFLRLKLFDLSHAAQVCVRFNQLAMEAFSIKFKHLKLDSKSLGITNLLRPIDVKILLSNFGSVLQSLNVDGNVIGIPIFLKVLQRMIGESCSNLKELELTNFDVQEVLYDQLYPILAKLERLTLKSCYFEVDMKHMLSNCNELKVLIFQKCKMNNWECIKQQFQQLDDIRLIANKYIDDDCLDRFIILNPTLTKFSIDDYNVGASLFRSIGHNLSTLIELDVIDYMDSVEFRDVIRELGQLRSLKVLKLNFLSNQILPLMTALAANNVPITHLKLHNGETDDEAVDNISQLKRITILELDDVKGLTDEHLIKLANQLPKLQELHFGESTDMITTIALKKIISHAKELLVLKLLIKYRHTIDIDDFKAMIKSIQDRPERSSLMIELTTDGTNVNVPDAILIENRDLVNINEHVEFSDDSDNFDEYFDTDFDDSYEISDFGEDDFFDNEYDEYHDDYPFY